jgi:hypothetical protein
MKVKKYLKLAAKVALLGDSKEASRQYRLGAVGLRSDGVLVAASNVSTRTPHRECHSEARLVRKLTKNSVVFVVRIDRQGQWRMAKPCSTCLCKLKQIKVKTCYYTIGPNEYGVLWF